MNHAPANPVKKIAIVGGGLAGLAAAHELHAHTRNGAQIEVSLFEAGPRFGGLLETHRQDGFVIECGADSWVTEKPHARILAAELGIESELIGSSDQNRRTYLFRNRTLEAMPDGMRMMVPIQWAPLLASDLFSPQAKLAYLREPRRAEELKAYYAANTHDESVNDFIQRHFGNEVAETLAAPLLSGVFGGSTHRLSAEAVMPAFVRLAREEGSLITALQRRANAATEKPESVFTSLRNGLESLPEAITAALPAAWLRRNTPVTALERIDGNWRLHANEKSEDFNAVILALPASAASHLLNPTHGPLAQLLRMDASSAIIAAFAFTPDQARTIRTPRGFGFLVPQAEGAAASRLMAATFIHQKFPHRTPDGGMIFRAFIGGSNAPELMAQPDASLLTLAHAELSRILGKLPDPHIALLRRWPNSLPQYVVGHHARLGNIAQAASHLPSLRLTGNAFHGVGMPDVIHHARTTAASLLV